MKPIFAFAASFSALLVLSSTAQSAEKLSLRPHWEPGKVYTMETQTDMSVAVPAAGGEQKTQITQKITVGVTAEASTGNRLAELKVAGIKATMGLAGNNMTYDSSDPSKSAPFLQQAFGAMLNKTFTMVFDKNDNYLEARGLENLTQGSPIGGANAMNGKQMAEMFRKSFDMSLPKDPVAPGDTWTFDDKMDMGPLGAMTVKINGKFDSVVDRDGKKHAKLLLDGKLASADGAGAGAAMMKIGEGSSFHGEVYFDLAQRITTHSENVSDIKMNVGGQELPMTQKTTTNMTSGNGK